MYGCDLGIVINVSETKYWEERGSEKIVLSLGKQAV
jgi:hypothetical protein